MSIKKTKSILLDRKKYNKISVSRKMQILYTFANDVQEFIGHPRIRHQYCNPRLLHSVIA